MMDDKGRGKAGGGEKEGRRGEAAVLWCPGNTSRSVYFHRDS